MAVFPPSRDPPAERARGVNRPGAGEAGFTSIQAAHLDGDIVNTYLIASKG
jgi:hypothetical protein